MIDINFSELFWSSFCKSNIYIYILHFYINQIMLSSNNFQTKYLTENDFNACMSTLNTKFSVFHLNIRSLNSHHGELLGLFITTLVLPISQPIRLEQK